ncbi:hypothetical protein GCK72_000433 [Caenorhabditis remanei]|uniref:Uncharacterized protein n=1 Tax=Caenorhabditis remanei TaxID=31234 RepID=A0A6A5HN45_CAERE|nr:hypothetical protein GCK72_000433 [Caenorhabditis remanei]KAF1768621.1 hypothetical protein GCK72_000433 [Caenorhabditis remanei]
MGLVESSETGEKELRGTVAPPSTILLPFLESLTLKPPIMYGAGQPYDDADQRFKTLLGDMEDVPADKIREALLDVFDDGHLLRILDHLKEWNILNEKHNTTDVCGIFMTALIHYLPIYSDTRLELSIEKFNEKTEKVYEERLEIDKKAADAEIEELTKKLSREENRAQTANSNYKKLLAKIENQKNAHKQVMQQKDEEIARLRKENTSLFEDLVRARTGNSKQEEVTESKKLLKEDLKSAKYKNQQLETTIADMKKTLDWEQLERKGMQKQIVDERERSTKLEIELNESRLECAAYLQMREKDKMSKSLLRDEETRTQQLIDYIGIMWNYQVRRENNKLFNFTRMICMLSDSQKNQEIEKTRKKLTEIRHMMKPCQIEQALEDIRNSKKAKKVFEETLEGLLNHIVKNPNQGVSQEVPTHATYLPIIREELQHLFEEQPKRI